MLKSVAVGLAGGLLALSLLVGPRMAVADEDRQWGDLVGRFTYDAEVPTPTKLEINKDQAYCGAKAPLDESLVVDAESRGVANVFVWLVPKLGQKIAIHPAYEESAKDDVVLGMKDCRFQPHALLLRTSQALVIRQQDTIGHSLKMDGFNNTFSNLLPSGSSTKHRLQHPETMPVVMSCSIHPWMTGRILIKDHPYMALSQPDGSFAIRNLPAGPHTFCFWHERGGYLDRPVIAGEVQEWKKGRQVFDIEVGEKDLGEIKLGADEFIRK